MQISINITTTGPLLTGQAPAVIQRNIEAFIVSTVMYILPRVQAKTPQGVYGAQGGLISSIQADFSGKGTMVVKGVIGTAQKYGEVIEKGRTAGKGMPPAGTLLRWLEVKLGLSEKDAKRIEFVVRRKIGQKGFDGAHMFEQGLLENWSWAQSNAGKYGLTIAKELNQ